MSTSSGIEDSEWLKGAPEHYRQQLWSSYWAMIDEGFCPYCGKPMTLERRSCCTHAVPCGHKLWKGRRP